jgi:hypothetical protein
MANINYFVQSMLTMQFSRGFLLLCVLATTTTFATQGDDTTHSLASATTPFALQ